MTVAVGAPDAKLSITAETPQFAAQKKNTKVLFVLIVERRFQ